MDREPGAVLVVENDPQLRDRIGRWLEAEGLEVVACPGPSHPDYRCIAGRGIPCPLAETAGAVVLDLWLASDRTLQGTSSDELLAYYLETGKPVVALSARHDHTRLINLFVEELLTILEWPPERRDLCETVGAILREQAADGGPWIRAGS
jgi:DNA-binding response OmpR family regulator